MAKKLKIPGKEATREENEAKQNELASVGLPSLQLDIQVEKVVDVGAAREAGDAQLVELAPRAQDIAGNVCEVELEDGIKLWMRTGALYRDFGKARTRGVAPDAGNDVWEIAPHVPRSTITRGDASGSAIKRVTVYKVRPAAAAPVPPAKPSRKQASRGSRGVLGDIVTDAVTDLAAERFAGDVGRALEEFQLRPNKPGLYGVDLAQEGLKDVKDLRLDANANFKGEGPFLLFIHGTMSSFAGSFGGLWKSDAGAEARKQLQGRYHQAYAFEHRTLSESPIENALALAAELPKGAKLHLVTHSRGGLVGDLLCLGQQEKGDLAPDLSFEDIFRMAVEAESEDARKHARVQQTQSLTKLIEQLERQKIHVERYVRAGCPARGTTLASNRLDRWLSIFKLLADLVPEVGLPLKLLLALIATHDDPGKLPGLEAMMPGSPLIHALNFPDFNVRADLSVISGDTESTGILGRLKELALDRFFEDESDIIVNTGAMYGGLKRASEGRFFLDTGRSVNHFHYFINDATLALLSAALLRLDGSDAGFQPISKAKEKEPARAALGRMRAPQGARPPLFLLPGIMGSHLCINGKRIWMSIGRLMLGGLADLKLNANVIELEGMQHYYDELGEYLQDTHEVISFPYDWRQSILEAGKRLAQEINAKQKTTDQPVRILAHSMGGLVARAMMAAEPKVWRSMIAREGSRLVMLGTPNGGSHEIMRLLVGRATTLQQLALLDLKRGAQGLLEIISRFPGVLELLPTANDFEFFSQAFWQKIKTDDKDARFPWVLPDFPGLDKARRTWADIQAAPLDPERVFYVAGCARATPIDWRIQDEFDYEGARPSWKTFVFEATERGDGMVPWETGIPGGVKAWYLEDVVHGDLPSHAPAFPAYVELLETGNTTRLSTAPPRSKRGAAMETHFDMPREAPSRLPAERDLAAAALGAGPPKRRAKKARLPKARVCITHGDLAYSRHPVMVGHYRGDTIVSAENYLDQALDGRLRDRHRLDLYPGALGTCEVFLNPNPGGKPGGAIVVGLGRVGDLSPGTLVAGVGRAVLTYALLVAEHGNSNQTQRRSAKISTLLIGTGAGEFTARDSIESILRGVANANRRLHDIGLDDKVWIDDLEFIELFEDVALSAATQLERTLRDGELAGLFEWRSGVVHQGEGGRRRVQFDAQADSWWHRLEIGYDAKRDELRFVALTDRARAEESLVAGQRRLADDFIRQAIGETSQDRNISRTLFEMLIPNRLKEMAPQQRNVVLLVDKVSGSYPWELLEDRWSEGKKPLAVAGGMLRQLKTMAFRERPAISMQDTAYVVGNPALPPFRPDFRFLELKGAEAEALKVADFLDNNGFRVTRQIHTSARSILAGLHAADYRVLHLAGHGVHDWEVEEPSGPASVIEDGALLTKQEPEHCLTCEQPMPKKKKRVSGMLIGDNTFLTPGDVEQMRWAPEIVFINCCHLGRLEARAPSLRYDQFAANIAAQFICMGVKAVVAAGWAVDDSAAETFAISFYSRLLHEDRFGDAVRAAREEAFDKHAHTNTWGAFQCYGDPDYRLRGRPKAVKKQRHYVSPAQAAMELENLTSSATMGDDVADELEDIVASVRAKQQDWLKLSAITAALGLAYGETGNFQKAIEYLDQALCAAKAEYSVSAIEQRANFKTRYAVALSRASKDEQKKASPLIDEAIQELNTLNAFGVSVERYSLLGSAYKRGAWVRKGNARKEALRQMQDNYHNAHKLAYKEKDRGSLNAYPLLNWLTAKILVKWPAALAAKDLTEIEDWCRKAEALAQQKEEENPSFWNSVVEADCDVVRALANKTLKKQKDEIVKRYQQAKKRGASAKQFSSTLEHLEFLTAITQTEELQEIKKRCAM